MRLRVLLVLLVMFVAGMARPRAIAAEVATLELTGRTKLTDGVEHSTFVLGEPRNVVNVAVIKPDAPVELRAAMVSSNAGKAVPEAVSALCRRSGCLVAVNADSFRPNGQPLGAVVSDEQVVVPMPTTLVPAHWQLSLRPDGLSVDVSLPANAREGTGSSYPLLLDGRVQAIAEETPFTLHRHPRTFIGWNSSGERIIATVDGRSSLSRGMTLAEGAALMLRLGATYAVNMDGGGSTTFVVNGNVVNRPSDGSERRVANAWVVVPRVSPPAAPSPTDNEALVVGRDADVFLATVTLTEPARPPKPAWTALAFLLAVTALHGHYLRWRTPRRDGATLLNYSPRLARRA